MPRHAKHRLCLEIIRSSVSRGFAACASQERIVDTEAPVGISAEALAIAKSHHLGTLHVQLFENLSLGGLKGALRRLDISAQERQRLAWNGILGLAKQHKILAVRVLHENINHVWHLAKHPVLDKPPPGGGDGMELETKEPSIAGDLPHAARAVRAMPTKPG